MVDALLHHRVPAATVFAPRSEESGASTVGRAHVAPERRLLGIGRKLTQTGSYAGMSGRGPARRSASASGAVSAEQD